MKLSELTNLIDEIVSEETLNTKDLEGPYTVYVKKGRLAGQTVMANKHKVTGVYYYLNPDTGHDEPIGDETSVDVQKKKIGESKQDVLASLQQFAQQHPDIIKQMRDWAKDCQWRDVEDESDIDEFSDLQILQGVNKYYEGGIKQFIADATPQQMNEIQRDSVGYWVDLNGKFNKVETSHRDFAGELLNKDPNEAFYELLKNGWVRVRIYHSMGMEVEYKKINDAQKESIRDFVRKNKIRVINNPGGKPPIEPVEEQFGGYVHDKDMKKDPKHIKGERWRIKFQSSKDLSKHGNTEKSPVKETITKDELKETITDLICEMWADIATGGKEKKGPTGRGTEAGADEPFVSLYKGGKEKGGDVPIYRGGKGEMTPDTLPGVGGGMSGGNTEESVNEVVDDFELGKLKAVDDFKNKVPFKKNPVGMSSRWIQGYKHAYGRLVAAEREKITTQLPDDRETQADFGLADEPEELQEVVMPHSQQTPSDTMSLWKLIEQLEVGQSINFYNPKNPNPNTTAPWVYIKKILTTDSGGEEAYGYNLSVEPRMDWKPTSVALRGHQNIETGDDVTEDEVSVALELVEQNRDVLSMYYIETEDAPRKRKPYQGDPDHDIGDYERFGPDQLRAQDVTEGKQMNEKREMLRRLIREAIQEVQDEDDMNNPEEKREVQIGNEILHLLAALRVNQNGIESDLRKIEELAKELIEMHSQSPSSVSEVSPPGFGGTVKAMKKHKDITNPFALAWWMKNRGYTSHK